jgi:glycerate kinase
MEQGFDLFARYARLREQLLGTDLVITGEGSLDASSLMGKGVGRLAARCHKLKLPCLGLAGHVSPEAKTSDHFVFTLSLDTLTTREKALTSPARWLSEAAATAARAGLRNTE